MIDWSLLKIAILILFLRFNFQKVNKFAHGCFDHFRGDGKHRIDCAAKK